MKPPSNASIRRALTILKKANIINLENHSINMELGFVATVAMIPTQLLAPKKSFGKKLPKHKKVIPQHTGCYEY